MSRAKTRRPGTRSGRRAESIADGRKGVDEIPEDLADAAEAALDDLINNAEAASALHDLEIEVQPMITTPQTPPLPGEDDPPTVRPQPAPMRVRPPGPPPPKSEARRADPTKPRVNYHDAARPRGQANGGRPAAAPAPRPASAPAARPPARPAPARGMTADLEDLENEAETDVLAELALDDGEPGPSSEPDAPAELRFAVFEDADHLAAARSAIVAAGHLVVINASSQTGAAKIAEAIAAGQVDAVLVGLPGGESVVAAAEAVEPRRPIVIAAYAGKATIAVKRALAAGIDLAVARPHEADRVAPILLAATRLYRERQLAQNARGAELVLRAKLEEIADPEPRGLQPFEVFQRVLELEFKRARRFEYPLSVALFAIEVTPPPPPAGIRGILRARAGNALLHTIRDVDIATQVDHERFLVLLPYTDLSGAAGVGRRVIAAVAEGDPVISAGRAFPPRVVGAVAQAKPGEPLSFAKLMKDATRALDQARRDGAELAVQP